MLSPIADGDTKQWEVLQWAFSQGAFNTPTEQLVLVYLAAHAFYEADNPEGAEVCQVMRQASRVSAIQAGTGLKDRSTVRRALNSLQDKAYIQREERKDPGIYGQQPHRIYVLWCEEALRESLRNGTRRLPPALMIRPSQSPKKAVELAPVVQLVSNSE